MYGPYGWWPVNGHSHSIAVLWQGTVVNQRSSAKAIEKNFLVLFFKKGLLPFVTIIGDCGLRIFDAGYR
jgi:hypothetical protein